MVWYVFECPGPSKIDNLKTGLVRYSVVDCIYKPCKNRALITTKHGPNFRGREGAQLFHGEHMVETGPECFHLFSDATLQGKVKGEVEVVVNVVDADDLVFTVGNEINTLQEEETNIKQNTRHLKTGTI